MQVNKIFDIKPTGKIHSYEDYSLTEKKGEWIPNKFIDKNIFTFNSNGQLISINSINQSDSIINSSVNFEYSNGLLLREITETKWGKSIKLNTYNNSEQLVKIKVENSSGDNYSYIHNYNELGRLIKSTVAFEKGTDIYIYDYQENDKTVIKTITINNIMKSIEHLKNGLLIKLIKNDNEITEFNYDDKQRLLKEKTIDFTREFKYNKDGFPFEYLGFQNEKDSNKEFYEIEFDKFRNWIEIKTFVETENFPKHLKSIRKRKINYT